MLFMISLAVAVLTGDAMLHLFPHVSLGSQSTKVIFNLYTGGKGKHSLNLLIYWRNHFKQNMLTFVEKVILSRKSD